MAQKLIDKGRKVWQKLFKYTNSKAVTRNIGDVMLKAVARCGNGDAIEVAVARRCKAKASVTYDVAVAFEFQI